MRTVRVEFFFWNTGFLNIPYFNFDVVIAEFIQRKIAIVKIVMNATLSYFVYPITHKLAYDSSVSTIIIRAPKLIAASIQRLVFCAIDIHLEWRRELWSGLSNLNRLFARCDKMAPFRSNGY